MSWEEIESLDLYLLKYAYPNEIPTHGHIPSKLYIMVVLDKAC